MAGSARFPTGSGLVASLKELSSAATAETVAVTEGTGAEAALAWRRMRPADTGREPGDERVREQRRTTHSIQEPPEAAAAAVLWSLFGLQKKLRLRCWKAQERRSYGTVSLTTNSTGKLKLLGRGASSCWQRCTPMTQIYAVFY